jgi:hypothetical protein
MVMFDSRLRRLDNLRIVVIEGKDKKWRVHWMSWNDTREEGNWWDDEDVCTLTYRVLEAKKQAVDFGRTMAKYEKAEFEIVTRVPNRIQNRRIMEDYTEKT